MDVVERIGRAAAAGMGEARSLPFEAYTSRELFERELETAKADQEELEGLRTQVTLQTKPGSTLSISSKSYQNLVKFLVKYMAFGKRFTLPLFLPLSVLKKCNIQSRKCIFPFENSVSAESLKLCKILVQLSGILIAFSYFGVLPVFAFSF